MTSNELIDFYLDHLSSSMTASECRALCSSVLEDWTCICVNKGIALVGHIYNHPKYPQGQEIKTSRIDGFFAKDMHIYITTQNSMYTLGVPNEEFAGDLELLFNDSIDDTTGLASNAFDDALAEFFLKR